MPRPKKRNSNYIDSCYVPDNWNPGAIAFPDLEQSYWYHIDLIIKRRIFQRNEKQEYIGLSALLLREVEPRSPEILRDMVALGILDTDGHWEPGVKCTGYRLNESLHRQPGQGQYYHARLITDPALLKRVRRFRLKEEAQVFFDIHRHLRSNLDKVQLDYERASDILNHLTGKKPRAILGQWYLLNQLASPIRTFTVCAYGRRVHTPVTSLMSCLRCCLHFGDGVPLVGLDIRNAQPFFLSALVINHWATWNASGKMGNMGNTTPFNHIKLPKVPKWGTFLNPEDPFLLPGEEGREETSEHGLHVVQKVHPQECPPPSLGNEPPDWLLSLQDDLRDLDDPEDPDYPLLLLERHSRLTGDVVWGDLPLGIKRFYDDCSTGVVYDKMARQSGLTRDKVKGAFFRHIMFCETKQEGKLAPSFESLYPEVMGIIRDMKRGKGKDRYKIASHLLQRQETYIILGRIATWLMKAYPELRFLTIHDSLLVHPDDADLVERVMYEVFHEIGCLPTIARHDYGA